ncbi:MAG: DUF4388 domain-containing protein [Myxococcales bacterium]|nr:DUF4388 domain-containing protein [Myxococcales bacterium]
MIRRRDSNLTRIERSDTRARRDYSQTIARDRAEIIRLIDRLRDDNGRIRSGSQPRLASLLDPGSSATSRERPAPRSRPSHATALASPAATQLIASSRPSPAFNTDAAVASALMRLEERLARIEAQLEARPAAEQAKSSGPQSGSDNYTLSGAIQGDLLSDVLQMISSNDLHGVFAVENEVGRSELYFSEGQIVHAIGPGTTGESAFFAAFALGSGRYFFTETEDLPSDRTIEGNTQFLILEALRRIDEQGEG